VNFQNISQPLVAENHINQNLHKDLLRFITCGSVDDGKSTLIGRLLYDSKNLHDDQIVAAELESKKYGTQQGALDLALLVDGLQSEREQGITIDVAYRFFSTAKRKFIIADTPGHEQYTRNMVTAASNAEAAIILIDARQGVLTQTKRHAYLVSLMGIRHVVVAINKMDLIGYSESGYTKIRQNFIEFSRQLKFDFVDFIPISALMGDNILCNSGNMSWYKGQALISALEDIKLSPSEDLPLRFPVQYVNRPNLDFRGYCGSIASGNINKGDNIKILPSGQTTKVASIIQPATAQKEAETLSASPPMSVTITTESKLDISRGDIVVSAEEEPQLSDKIEVMLVWMNKVIMNCSREYIIKHATSMILGRFLEIDYVVNINTLEQQSDVNILDINDIGQCQLSLTQPILLDPYAKNQSMGRFIVIDRITNETLGAGIVLGASTQQCHKLCHYSSSEKALNQFIRKHYPEWGCVDI